MVTPTLKRKLTKHRHFKKTGVKEVDDVIVAFEEALKEVDTALLEINKFLTEASKSPFLKGKLIEDVAFDAGERVRIPNPLKRPIQGFVVVKSTAETYPLLLRDQQNQSQEIWMTSDSEGVYTLAVF